MAGNISPIYSRVGDVQGSVLLLAPVAATAAGYTGTDANTYVLYQADPTNGGFVQRIRVKAAGTNPANVMRFWIVPSGAGHLTSTATAPATPTATLSATTSTGMYPGTYYMKVQAIDAMGQPGPFSTEISNTVPSTGNNIVWGWTASANAASYRLAIGTAANTEQFVISNVSGTSYTQSNSYFIGPSTSNTSIIGSFSLSTLGGTLANTSLTLNTSLLGEVSIPLTTASATAATAEIDYPLNIAVPPGAKIVAGIGTVTANGYIATVVAGKY